MKVRSTLRLRRLIITSGWFEASVIQLCSGTGLFGFEGFEGLNESEREKMPRLPSASRMSECGTTFIRAASAMCMVRSSFSGSSG